MAEIFAQVPSLGQTAPVDRVRDSRRGAIDQEGKRKRPRKSEPSAPASGTGSESPDSGSAEDHKKSGHLVDIVI
ncbi:MAG: hypothetical protein HY892_09575 [Deltaproteobacteria bacterium]|nr:hypothetical protein [Deltaproteobacteria bacterium]